MTSIPSRMAQISPLYFEADYRACTKRDTFLIRVGGDIVEGNLPETHLVNAVYCTEENADKVDVATLLAWAATRGGEVYIVLPMWLCSRIQKDKDNAEKFRQSKPVKVMEVSLLNSSIRDNGISVIRELIEDLGVSFVIRPEAPQSPIEILLFYGVRMDLRASARDVRFLWTRVAYFGAIHLKAMQELITSEPDEPFSLDVLRTGEALRESADACFGVPIQQMPAWERQKILSATHQLQQRIPLPLVKILVPLAPRRRPTVPMGKSYGIMTQKLWMRFHLLNHHWNFVSLYNPWPRGWPED